MKIILKHNKAFNWFCSSTLFFKGYFYIDENYYEKNDAFNYLSKIETKEEFLKLIKKINGVYSIILTIENTTIITSDTTRIFTLFYSRLNNETYISDDIIHLKKLLNLNEFNTQSELELKASLHTYGNKTLVKNIFQVQSDECLIFKNGEIIDSRFIFNYSIKKSSKLPYEKLKSKAINVFENSFDRLVRSLNNKTAVIPLSAGYDSRLIASMLKKHNYKNVVCFTYGKKNSFEIENSKKVAETLGFKWYFIEYNNQIIGNYLDTDQFKNYAHYAGKLSSMPYMQEYFAVKYLKENNLISNDSIFIPGFAGDLLGGSQFLKVIPEKLESKDIIDLIIKQKFGNFVLKNSEIEKEKKEIKHILYNYDADYLEKIPSSVFEDFDVKEKIAKLIFNSANFYTFFGYEHRFPFWDKEILDFFKSLPISYKKMKLLFNETLMNHYFKPLNISFEKEEQPSKKQISIQNLKNKIKPFLPTFYKIKFLKKNDWNNYEAITRKMLVSLEKNNLKVQLKLQTYNEVLVQWYIHFSKRKL